MCQDGLRTRKLCQSPMPDHCCNSGIFRGTSPRCFLYTITWTEESTCNAKHGIGIWSAEQHWEADPITAGRRSVGRGVHRVHVHPQFLGEKIIKIPPIFHQTWLLYY